MSSDGGHGPDYLPPQGLDGRPSPAAPPSSMQPTPPLPPTGPAPMAPLAPMPGAAYPAAPPPPAGPHGPRRIGLSAGAVSALAVAAVIALVLVVAFVAGLRNPRPKPPTRPPFTMPSVTFPSVRPIDLPSYTPPPPPPSVAPVHPGWTGLAATNDQAAYDVGPDFTVAKPDLFVGFEAPGEVVAARRVAQYRVGSCVEAGGKDKGDRGLVGFGMRSETSDVRAWAETLATRWARIANTRYDDGKAFPIGEPVTRQVPIHGGELAWASTIEFDVGYQSKYSCEAPAMRITVVAMAHPSLNQIVTLVIASDQGIDGALTVAEENEIIATFRRI